MAALALATLFLAGCGQKKAIDTAQYPDPPASEWLYTLTVYWAFNTGGGEYPGYTLSAEGVVEEGTREDPAATPPPGAVEGELVLDDLPMPGGRDYSFRGAAPGDVVLTMHTENEKGKTVHQRTYVLRVNENLQIAVLDILEED